MADSTVEKRTRSQLTLPDDIFKVPQRSPLKDARTALRHLHKSQEEEVEESDAPDTDDELLLSPTRKGKQPEEAATSKRPASPRIHDGYTLDVPSPSTSREPKRVKRDLQHEPATSMQTPSAMDSRPPPYLVVTTPSRSRKHSDATTSPTRRSKRTSPVKSNRSASPTPSTYSNPDQDRKARAQSVPPTFFPQAIPHIDLRTVPPSPTRSRSRSPSKDRLKFTFDSFPSSSKLDVVPNSSNHTMDDDSRPALAEEANAPLDISSSKALDESSKASPNPPPTPILHKQNATPNIPFTPMTTQSLNRLIPLSPLTPVPATPFPQRANSTVQARLASKLGWGMEPVREDDAFADKPSTNTVSVHAATQSRIPRPPVPSTTPIPAETKKPAHRAAPPKVKTTYTQPTIVSMFKSKTDKAQSDKRYSSVPLMGKPGPSKLQPEEKAKALAKTTAHVSRSGPSTTARPRAKQMMKGREKQTPVDNKLVPVDDDDDDDNPFTSSAITSTPAQVEPTTSTNVGQLRVADDNVSGSLNQPAEDVIMDEPEDLRQDFGSPLDTALEATPDSPGGDGLVEEPPESSPVPPEAEDASQESGGEVLPKSPDKAKVSDTEPNELRQLTQLTSKPSLGKRRAPTVAPANRVTRSVSSRKQGKEPAPVPPAAAKGPSVPSSNPAPAAVKRTSSGVVKKGHNSPDGDRPKGRAEDVQASQAKPKPNLPPASPMKTASLIKSPSKGTLFSTIKATIGASSPLKMKNPFKPNSTPSPAKGGRGASTFTSRPVLGLGRTFSMETLPGLSSANSSLSTLSNALEKLKQPAQARPSTSMGFNPDSRKGGNEFKAGPSAKDDSNLGRTGQSDTKAGVQRAVTLGSAAFKVASTEGPSSSKAADSKGKLIQKPLANFLGGAAKFGPPTGPRSLVSKGPFGKPKASIGFGTAVRRTISKKSSLPVVIGSPVKGGRQAGQSMDDEDEDDTRTEVADNDGDVFMAPATTASDDPQPSEKSKGKEKAVDSGKSRRVSMLSHAFSLSLVAPPPPEEPPTKMVMGPPPTPSKRSDSGSVGSSSPSQGSAPGTRTSARLATKVSEASTSSSKKPADTATPPNPNAEIMKDCKIFVDVKTDGGDEAGSLFVTLLESMGARILSRVGATCTHIVFKNGLMSTISRYRSLNEPKPLVIGIGWVVECVEQRKRLEETPFLIDLENTNIAGVNKRRRSMLPKLLAPELAGPEPNQSEEVGDGDVSMESQSSLGLDDDLPPLERARRRKIMMAGS